MTGIIVAVILAGLLWSFAASGNVKCPVCKSGTLITYDDDVPRYGKDKAGNSVRLPDRINCDKCQLEFNYDGERKAYEPVSQPKA